MPISPISSLDLINISRSGTLVNAVDGASSFDIAITGSDVDNAQSPVSILCGIDTSISSLYQVAAEIDWLGLILSIPDGAIITNIEIRARVNGYNVSATSVLDETSTDRLSSSLAEVTALARIVAPNTSIIPDTNNSILEQDSESASAVNIFNLSAAVSLLGSSIIRKIWNLTTQPGGGISKVELESDFTDLEIEVHGTSAHGRIQFISGTDPPGSSTYERSLVCNISVADFHARITWEYQFNWLLSPDELSVVDPEDLITITSSGPDALLLDQLTVEMGGLPIVPITQTPNELTFLVPSLADGLHPIIVTGNGTQFSGTIPLGAYEILTPEASGIYQIIPGQRHDTLYHPDRNGETYDVKIPNPFIESGFVRDGK